MLSVPVPVRLTCILGSYLCIVDGGQLGVVATKRQEQRLAAETAEQREARLEGLRAAHAAGEIDS